MIDGPLPRLLARLDRFGRLAEDVLLALLLSGMILLASAQIILRNLFSTGFLWGDELLRIILLWLGLTGAMAATRNNKHVTIDVVSRFLPERYQGILRTVLDFISAAVCATLAWYALRFVRMEAEAGSILLGKYPSWYFQAIIPVGFAVIALRYTQAILRRYGFTTLKEDHK